MVNAGRRSMSCFLCRDRRVKCDLRKPSCQRCMNAKRLCPGYPDPWDTVLRPQNVYAESRVHARITRAKKQSSNEARGEVQVLPRAPDTAAHVYSWNQFYHDYITHSGLTLFNVLPSLYLSSTSKCFKEAIHSVALVSSARQLRQPVLMERAIRHYVEAIAAVNLALNDTSLAGSDSVLLALFLLSFFEMIAPENFRQDADFQCHAHFRGSLVLLRWRAERGLKSQLDGSYFTFLSHICLVSMFLNNEPFDVKWLSLESFATPWMKGSLLEPVLDRAISFKRRAHTYIKTGHSRCQAKGKELISAGIAISEDLKITAASVKSSSNSDLPSHQQPKAFNNMFEVSTKATEAVARTLYQLVRYTISELVSSLMDLMGGSGTTSYDLDSQSHVSTRHTILEQSCTEILALLAPPTSGRNLMQGQTGIGCRAYSIFWPLLMILFSSSAGEERRVWAREQLRFIGEMSGLGLASWAARSTAPSVAEM